MSQAKQGTDRMLDLDLNVDAPDKVAAVLRRAAEAYYATESELQAAWQDRTAGRVWREMAKALERAAIRCEQANNLYA